MSKNSKKTKKIETPMRKDGAPALDLYKELPEDNKCQNDCIVIDKHGQYFRFKSPSHSTIVKDGVALIFRDFNDFTETQTMQDVHGYHEALLKVEVPAEMRTDEAREMGWIHLKLIVWKAICRAAADRTEKPVAKDRVTGEPKTGKLKNREYELVDAGEGDIKTPQELTCLRFIVQSVDPTTKKIKEEELKQIVTKRAEELRTKQDPWRIFQYYRPALINKKHIRLI